MRGTIHWDELRAELAQLAQQLARCARSSFARGPGTAVARSARMRRHRVLLLAAIHCGCQTPPDVASSAMSLDPPPVEANVAVYVSNESTDDAYDELQLDVPHPDPNAELTPRTISRL